MKNDAAACSFNCSPLYSPFSVFNCAAGQKYCQNKDAKSAPPKSYCFILLSMCYTTEATWQNKHPTNITIHTQNIQRALVVGDDDIGPLRLQMLPPTHFKSKTQQILHMTNHEADNPEEEMVNYC